MSYRCNPNQTGATWTSADRGQIEPVSRPGMRTNSARPRHVSPGSPRDSISSPSRQSRARTSHRRPARRANSEAQSRQPRRPRNRVGYTRCGRGYLPCTGDSAANRQRQNTAGRTVNIRPPEVSVTRRPSTSPMLTPGLVRADRPRPMHRRSARGPAHRRRHRPRRRYRHLTDLLYVYASGRKCGYQYIRLYGQHDVRYHVCCVVR